MSKEPMAGDVPKGHTSDTPVVTVGARPWRATEQQSVLSLWSPGHTIPKLPMPLNVKRVRKEKCGVNFALRASRLQEGHALGCSSRAPCTPKPLLSLWRLVLCQGIPAALFPSHPLTLSSAHSCLHGEMGNAALLTLMNTLGSGPLGSRRSDPSQEGPL